jgi:hypothetical protein
MVLNLINSLNWMGRYRDYVNLNSFVGSDMVVFFFFLSTIITIFTGFYVGLLLAINIWFIDGDIDFVKVFLTLSAYLIIIMFVSVNGLVLINELVLKMKKQFM